MQEQVPRYLMSHGGAEKGLSDLALLRPWINPAAMGLELVCLLSFAVTVLRNRNSMSISKSDISAAMKEHRRYLPYFSRKYTV